jgi:hypothetical protein
MRLLCVSSFGTIALPDRNLMAQEAGTHHQN